jgi:hypothetical protein
MGRIIGFNRLQSQKSPENQKTQEGNIQAVPISVHGSVPSSSSSSASDISSGSDPILDKPTSEQQRGIVSVVHIRRLPQADVRV